MRRPWPRRRYAPANRRAPRSLLRKALDLFLAVAILGLLALVAARQEQVATREMQGNAIAKDGDSIEIGSERIRLSGIDAPEYNQSCAAGGRDYPCGRRSLDALKAMIGGRLVSCAGWQRDRYGRLLALCRAGDVDLNRRQVASGWAVAYGDYQDVEDEARAAGLGIWAGTFQTPHDFRENAGEASEPVHDHLSAVFGWLRQIFGFAS